MTVSPDRASVVIEDNDGERGREGERDGGREGRRERERERERE